MIIALISGGSFMHVKATKDNEAKRLLPEEPCLIRGEFQRDRDKILHSKAFRRLKHKTQVFISTDSDHYRTRLTHTFEVSQIARTIARALDLNEDLTEAIALGHDIGHTPFGHAGEFKLAEVSGIPFRHYEYSVIVAKYIEREGKGLNLTDKVLEGILKHSKGMGDIFDKRNLASTLEGQIVRLADIIAYVNHDFDDAVRSGLLTEKDLPFYVTKRLGDTSGKRLDTIILDIINETKKCDYDHIAMSEEVLDVITKWRNFLYEKVYTHPLVQRQVAKVETISFLFNYYLKDGFNEIPHYIIDSVKRIKNEQGKVFNYSIKTGDDVKLLSVVFYIAGMTDRYIVNKVKEVLNIE